jgi:two-component system response regulator FixJ
MSESRLGTSDKLGTGSTKPCVFIVDDDEPVRDSLDLLIRSVGYDVESYASALEFLDAYDDRPGCLVLDVRMPQMSGLDLQQELVERHAILPIIFMTGHGDVPMAVQAMRGGAVDFLQKPLRDQDLLDRINEALRTDAQNRELLAQKQETAQRLQQLTAREREVMALVAAGKANKVIAYELDVSQRTVEIHRARVMEKMRATSLAHLVRMVVEVDWQPTQS